MNRERGPKLPDARATSLFARTIFRQLRQAGYSRPAIVGFVNDMLDVVAAEPDDAGPLSGIADPETRLANSEVLVGTLGFEMKRARDGGSTVLVVSLDVGLPEWSPDESSRLLHERIARQLPRALRPQDTVARVTSTQYILVLPGAPAGEIERIVRRVVSSALASRRADDLVPEGTTIKSRSLLFDGASSTAAANAPDEETAEWLLARVGECAPLDHDVTPETRAAQVALGTGRAQGASSHARPPSRSTRPPPPSRPNEVVLALGGGAARAAAHIGVLKGLRTAGIEVAGVAGTSAGAIVGAMFLSGMEEEAILERFETFTRSPVYMRMRRLYATYRRAARTPRAAISYFRQSGLAFVSNVELSAIDDETFEEFIEHFVGKDRDIAALGGRFAAAATDLTTGRGVILNSGPLHFALRASCAVPGLFRPQLLDARALSDGATISEVPVHAARSLPLSAPVVAVYLSRPEEEIKAFGSSAEVLTRTTSIIHKELVREQLRYAPELITALVEEIAWLDFRKARETADIGFIAATAYAARVRQL